VPVAQLTRSFFHSPKIVEKNIQRCGSILNNIQLCVRHTKTKMQGKKEYTEQLFYNFRLSDHIPENNFYRQLREKLDLSFLRQATKKYYGTEGNKSIDPVVFFKLILMGYIENLNSDRRIMDHASVRLDVRYFIGYDKIKNKVVVRPASKKSR
jgi:transposase